MITKLSGPLLTLVALAALTAAPSAQASSDGVWDTFQAMLNQGFYNTPNNQAAAAFISSCRTKATAAEEVANYRLYFDAFIAVGFYNLAENTDGFALAYCKQKYKTPQEAAATLMASFNALLAKGFYNLPSLVLTAAADL